MKTTYKVNDIINFDWFGGQMKLSGPIVRVHQRSGTSAINYEAEANGRTWVLAERQITGVVDMSGYINDLELM